MSTRSTNDAALCWVLLDETSPDRFVTHLVVPALRLRLRLPAPMPETWVPVLLFLGAAIAFLTFMTASALGHGALFATVAAAAGAYLTGLCYRPAAAVRLRMEALRVIHLRDPHHK